MSSLSDDGVGSAAEEDDSPRVVEQLLPMPTAPSQWLGYWQATRYARLIREKNPYWLVWTCAATKERWALYVQMSRERVTEGAWVFTARQAEEYLT